MKSASLLYLNKNSCKLHRFVNCVGFRVFLIHMWEFILRNLYLFEIRRIHRLHLVELYLFNLLVGREIYSILNIYFIITYIIYHLCMHIIGKQ